MRAAISDGEEESIVTCEVCGAPASSRSGTLGGRRDARRTRRGARTTRAIRSRPTDVAATCKCPAPAT
jgi:hypothetical protein